jgi:hypothetical protein
MVKVKTRSVCSNDIPDDFYPDYVFDDMVKDESLLRIEMKFENDFKFYFATSQYINSSYSTDVVRFFIEEYHLTNLEYCSKLVNGAMNPSELYYYLSREEDKEYVTYEKCNKLLGFYRKYKEEIKYVIKQFRK